jgi:hypothetical protein
MTKLRERAQARTMQIVGQMIGDNELVQEGKEQQRQAEKETESSGKQPDADKQQ